MEIEILEDAKKAEQLDGGCWGSDIWSVDLGD